MATRATLYSRNLFILSGLLFSSCVTVQAASFDCQNAATTTEKTICANDVLSGKDEAIADSYQQLMAILPQRDAAALRGEQRNWLKQRNECTGDAPAQEACLKPLFIQRERTLNERLRSTQHTLDNAIASLPANPVDAAVQLRKSADPLAKAWLVYLHYFVPVSGVGVQEAQRAENAASTALKARDDLAWSIWQDVRSDPKTSREEAALLLLRMSIEGSDYEATARPYVHCFIFTQPGEAVWQAFGPLYGSSRDSFAPICPPQGGLFKQEAWKVLRNQFAGPESAVSPNAGTLRYASFAAWRLFALRATLSPRDYIKPNPEDLQRADKNDAQHRIHDWTDEKVWPATQRQLTIAAIEPARQATAHWLQLERGFSASDAQAAATHIVQLWLAQHLDYLAENSDSE